MAQSQPAQDNALRIQRHYPVSCEKVWKAWTEPQALAQWFGPDGGPVHEAHLDVQVGGTWRIAFSTEDGERHGVSGVYQEVEQGRRLVFTWAWQSTPERVSLVTVELQPEGSGCMLRMTHERFFNQEALTGHTRGWTGTFAKLDAFVASI